eukprot:1995284-Amphidinium_carterae.1
MGTAIGYGHGAHKAWELTNKRTLRKPNPSPLEGGARNCQPEPSEQECMRDLSLGDGRVSALEAGSSHSMPASARMAHRP